MSASTCCARTSSDDSSMQLGCHARRTGRRQARLFTRGATPGVTPMAVDDLCAAPVALAHLARVRSQLLAQNAGYGCQP